MDTNKMREQFEAAYDRGDFLCMDGPYDNPRKNQALAIWIASREAVVVELPEAESPESYGVTQKDDPEQYQVLESRMGAQYSAIFKCKRAIEAQGLKVTP